MMGDYLITKHTFRTFTVHTFRKYSTHKGMIML